MTETAVCSQGFGRLEQNFWFNVSAAQAAAQSGSSNPLAAVEVYPCLSSGACLVNFTSANVTCGNGYRGVLCALCETGYGQSGFSCSKCFGTGLNWVLLILFFAVLFAILGVAIVRVLRVKERVLSTSSSNEREIFTTLKILLNFIQTTSFLANFNLDWPTAVLGMFSTLGTAGGFSLESSFISCALQWGAHQMFLFFFILPFLVVLIPAATIGSRILLFKYREKTRLRLNPSAEPQPPPLFLGVSPRGLYTAVVMIALFMLYPTLCRQCLSMLHCSEPIEGVQYLSTDFEIQCDEAGHKPFVWLAVLQAAFFAVGFPVAAWHSLFLVRHNLADVRVARRFRFLYGGYREEVFWWESIIMVRKLLLVAISIFLSSNKYGHQVYAGIWVLLVALVMHIYFRPLRDRLQGQLEQGALTVALFSLLLGQLLSLGGVSKGGKSVITIAITVGNIGITLWAVLIFVGDVLRAAKLNEMAVKMREALTVRGNRKRGASGPVSRAGSGSTPKQSAWSKLSSMIRGQRLRRINATDEEIEEAWSMHYDEVMDKWFWYNDITEESSWAEDEDDEEGEGTSAGVVADSGQGGSRHVGDWEERIHPSNGMKYYVNKVLRKQQWEMPACFSDQGIGHWEPRRHPTAQAWFYLNTVTGQVRTDVPPEVEARDPYHKYAWEEKVHPQNGKRYYVNLVTRKQQWTRPAGLDEGVSAAISSTTPTAQATSTVGSAPAPSTPEFHTSNPMRQARDSEVSSQVQPSPAPGAVSASHDSYEEEDAEDTRSEQTPSVPAEVGWIKSLDPTSGSYYWFHTGTGESKWIDSESESGSEDDWSATSDDASMTRGSSPV